MARIRMSAEDSVALVRAVEWGAHWGPDCVRSQSSGGRSPDRDLDRAAEPRGRRVVQLTVTGPAQPCSKVEVDFGDGTVTLGTRRSHLDRRCGERGLFPGGRERAAGRVGHLRAGRAGVLERVERGAALLPDGGDDATGRVNARETTRGLHLL